MRECWCRGARLPGPHRRTLIHRRDRQFVACDDGNRDPFLMHSGGVNQVVLPCPDHPMALFGLAGVPTRTSRNRTGNPKWDAEPRRRGGTRRREESQNLRTRRDAEIAPYNTRNEVVNRKFKLVSAMCIAAHVHGPSDILRLQPHIPCFKALSPLPPCPRVLTVLLLPGISAVNRLSLFLLLRAASASPRLRVALPVPLLRPGSPDAPGA